MINFLGNVFKTLSYRVDKEIAESLYKNEVFLNSQWSYFENCIINWSMYYKKYILLSLILSVLIVSNLVLWQAWIKPYFPQCLPNCETLFEWQDVFLGGQLTVIGVVYPLVIGLIGVLFQNKSAKKVIFPVYQKYTGFMFAGLSGLALSGFIVAGYFLKPSVSDSVYIAICLTSAMWLFSNLLLTTWFFVKTFRMLDENSRDSIVFRYSIHEICEVDVRERIKELLLGNAVQHKLLINPDALVMEVLTYKFSENDYQEITRIVKKDKSLKEVRFWLINVAIKLQLFILKFKKIKGCKLVIQPFHSSRTGNVNVVAKYDGFEVNFLVQLLIKVAFSFESKMKKADFGLTAVLKGFVGPARDALRERDSREFAGAINNLVLWHTEVAEALSFKDDNDSLDNWLFLPVSGMWGRTYLEELLGEYYRLAKEAVERIPENSSFYTKMLNLHMRIFTSRDVLVKKEIRSLIQGSYYMWYLLIEWRSYNSESSDMRIANKYEDILYDFVGAWEGWLMYIEPRSKRSGDINKTYPAFMTHIEFTALTAVSALRFNNYEAAGWGVDMLINWIANFSHNDHSYQQYSWRSNLIQLSYIPLNSAEPAWQPILRGNEYDHEAAFGLAFMNAHLDLRVITACFMLLKPSDGRQDLLIEYIKSLLSGTRIHPTGAVERPLAKIRNAGELLGAYIRQRDYLHYGEGTYGKWLSSILESFGRVYEGRWVSGRIYSGWGVNDPRSLNRAYVEIAISLSESKWSLPSDWEDAILSDAFRYVDQASIITDLRDWIKIASNDLALILLNPEQKETFKTNFIESVEGVIKKIEDVQNQVVVQAEIDQDRLKHFGVVSSAVFMKQDKLEFPFVLFEKIDQDADLDDSFSRVLNIIDYSKERVARVIDTNRSVNEDEWMANCISNDLKLNVLRALLRHPQTASLNYIDINNILNDILIESETFACPVLFVGNQALSNALYRSFHDREFAQSYNISRQDGFGSEYICHIGRCEVYLLGFSDVDYSVLTTKELFDTVSFKKVAQDQYVKVDFELNESSDTVGKLKFKYWMKVALTESIPCIRLELAAKEEDFL